MCSETVSVLEVRLLLFTSLTLIALIAATSFISKMRVFVSLVLVGWSVASASLLATRNETANMELQQVQNQTSMPLPDCAVRLEPAQRTRMEAKLT